MAAVLTDGRNTFYGMNSWKTHPLQKKFGKNDECIHIHAEIDAIRNALRAGEKSLKGYTLYVARVLANDEPAIAMPCEGCQRAIAAFNVTECIWTE